MNQGEKKDHQDNKKGTKNLTWIGKKMTSAHLLIITYTIIIKDLNKNGNQLSRKIFRYRIKTISPS